MMRSPNQLLSLRRAARADKSAGDWHSLDAHRRVAQRLAVKSQAQQLRSRALAQVDVWERDRLCNASYVRAWRALLHQPLSALRDAMLRDDVEGVALRQNSPFGFALKDD